MPPHICTPQCTPHMRLINHNGAASPRVATITTTNNNNNTQGARCPCRQAVCWCWVCCAQRRCCICPLVWVGSTKADVQTTGECSQRRRLIAVMNRGWLLWIRICSHNIYTSIDIVLYVVIVHYDALLYDTHLLPLCCKTTHVVHHPCERFLPVLRFCVV